MAQGSYTIREGVQRGKGRDSTAIISMVHQKEKHKTDRQETVVGEMRLSCLSLRSLHLRLSPSVWLIGLIMCWLCVWLV